nr:integrase, catalytic region, zinc finger, CCHC-type, peptidase aspartic, catalytic [Tanacetum cinerariifolium]
MIIKKYSKIVKEKVERKSLGLKAKKESSDEECSTSGSEDEQIRHGDKNQITFVGGSWSDSDEEDDEKVNNKTCLATQASSESTCYIRDLKGNDLLTSSRGTDLYSITLQDTTSPNPICLMAKATSSSLSSEL